LRDVFESIDGVTDDEWRVGKIDGKYGAWKGGIATLVSLV
jgi:hypothetical protein